MRVRWHNLNCIPVLILSLLMTVVLPRVVTNHGLRDQNHYWYIMSFFPYSNCQLTSVSPRFHWQNAIRQSPHTVETSPPPVLPDISEAVFIIIVSENSILMIYYFWGFMYALLLVLSVRYGARQMTPIIINHFLSANSRSAKGPGCVYSETERKRFW